MSLCALTSEVPDTVHEILLTKIFHLRVAVGMRWRNNLAVCCNDLEPFSIDDSALTEVYLLVSQGQSTSDEKSNRSRRLALDSDISNANSDELIKQYLDLAERSISNPNTGSRPRHTSSLLGLVFGNVLGVAGSVIVGDPHEKKYSAFQKFLFEEVKKLLCTRAYRRDKDTLSRHIADGCHVIAGAAAAQFGVEAVPCAWLAVGLVRVACKVGVNAFCAMTAEELEGSTNG